MAARIDRLIYSSTGLRFLASLAQAVPPRVGYAVAGFVARWIASRRDSDLVRDARTNQQMIAGGSLSPAALDAALQAVFRHAGRSLYDLYHYIQDPAAIERMFDFDESCRIFLDRREREPRGLILAALHTPGWDLGLRHLCRDRLKSNPLVLTIPSPEGGRQLEFEGREQVGMEIIPASVNGLHRAVRHLQQGGFVMTGIDRPVPGADPQPRFFGQPAMLPVHHVYLALKSHSPIVVEISLLEGDGRYHVHASPPIEMEPRPDRTAELVLNAEKVLSVVEGFLENAPQQWLMFLPVWPAARNDGAR